MMGWILAAVVAILCAALLLWRRRREQALFARLEAMLTAATNGTFHESDFSETIVSSLESQLAQYLQSGTDAAQRLSEQRDQIATLVSDVSHQTKTPVANIRLYSQLLAEQPLPAEAQECVIAIATQTEKLDGLIAGLVKSSRLETGIIALHPFECDLAPLVESAVRQYRPRAVVKGITLSLDETHGHALCDPKWSEEALCNLLDNAIKYTPTGGHVRVEVRCYTFFCAISVQDDGPGIAEDEQARIFSRFYRAPSAFDKPGVGIGLYLARQIATGQGGYIKCSSKPGEGSTFALYLPTTAPHETERKENDPC